MANPPEIRQPKLHELLAVRTSLETQAASQTKNLANTFEKKEHLFSGRIRSFTPDGEDAPTKTEESIDIQTTVAKELSWLKQHVSPWLDNVLHIATGNTAAVADIQLEDGTVLAAGIPTSCLLDLERIIDGLRIFALTIPTLDPAKGFALDADKGDGVYAARKVEKVRREKRKKIYTLAPATEKHAAQVQLIDEDVPTGLIHEQEWSAMYTPAQKAEVLARIESLARAVKRARMRANTIQVDVHAKIGEILYRHAFHV